MAQQQIEIILVVFKVTLLVLIVLGTCLYALPLCLVRRFHTPVHFLTLNICFTAGVCASFWAIYFVMSTFYPEMLWSERTCLPVIYLQTTVNCQALYALCVVSLNRLCTIVYPKTRLFCTKKWVAVCVGIQWLVAATIPLPIFVSTIEHCVITGLELIYQVYSFVIVTVLPTIVIAITNIVIFTHTRRSTYCIRAAHTYKYNSMKNAPVLSQRDSRLLKHMLFMFFIFVLGWLPIYIVATVDWNGTSIPHLVLNGLGLLPALSSLADIINLFLYNHELRQYLAARRRMVAKFGLCWRSVQTTRL